MKDPNERKPVAGRSAQPFKNFQRMQNPKETAQEAIHEVMLKAPFRQPSTPTSGKTVVNAPMHAAKGDDDLMSQQQQQSLPSADEVKGIWKQKIGAAKITWGRLTEDELLTLEGHEQKLIGLIQERYAITRDEADIQVKAFFDANK